MTTWSVTSPGGGTKTFEELMLLGSPYERLVAVNGKPLSPEQQAQEQQKLEKRRRSNARKNPGKNGSGGSRSTKKNARAITS